MTTLPELKFHRALDQDLIQVIIQHWQTLDVLMLGTMNRETLTLTLENDIVYLYALSRREVWLKGEKSGIYLEVKDIRVNCNVTNLLILVEYKGNICHTGASTCFSRRLVKDNEKWLLKDLTE